MNIVSKTKVAEAYARALNLHTCRESAVRAVARALCIPIEAVRDAMATLAHAANQSTPAEAAA